MLVCICYSLEFLSQPGLIKSLRLICEIISSYIGMANLLLRTTSVVQKTWGEKSIRAKGEETAEHMMMLDLMKWP